MHLPCNTTDHTGACGVVFCFISLRIKVKLTKKNLHYHRKLLNFSTPKTQFAFKQGYV